MNEEKYTTYTTEDFVLDDWFISWVLDPDQKTNTFWSKYIENHPNQKNSIDQAAFIVRSARAVEPEIPDHRIESMLKNIEARRDQEKQKSLPVLLKYAASITFLILAGTILYLFFNNDSQFPLANLDPVISSKGRVTLSDGTTHEFDTKETTIQQTQSGNIKINNDTLININDPVKNNDGASFIQVTIPHGKISEIMLSDGTHIWLNSGSQLSYPSEFKSNTREVYLSGEAFFDVTHNPKKPFIVNTEELKISVLGTSFNVSCYREDPFVHTVLADGKISASRDKIFSKSIEVNPGEKLEFDKKSETFEKRKVDVRSYTSWVNGYLIFENTPTTLVFKKLERFYNTKIIAQDDHLTKITFSGKLDLKENIEEVLDMVSFASSVQVIQSEGQFIINP